MARPAEIRVRHDSSSWWLAIAVTLAAAAALRVCHLGTFSLALDEVFTMTRAVQPFGAMLAACAADAENVPGYLVITYGSLRLGLTDPWIRLVPVAAGLASILVWSWWVRRHLGSVASLLAAGFMALSTYHIRYSQELRAYPYLLLLTGLFMLAADRLRSRPDIWSALWFAALVAAGWYVHFSFALILAPALAMTLVPVEGSDQGPPRRLLPFALAAAASALGTLAFLPWFLRVSSTLGTRLSRVANEWSLDLVARRWQFLTVAAREGEPADWLGLGLAGLAAIGLIAAARQPVGRAALIPAALAIVAEEAALVEVNRWSQGRYNAAVWPFIAIAIAAGAIWLGRRVRARWLGAAAVGVAALALLVRVDAYHRTGRPHWDRVALAISEARRPGEPVLAERRWGEVCLSHYSEHPIGSLDYSPIRLMNALRGVPSVLLFVPSRVRQTDLRQLARSGAIIADVPWTGTLVRLRSDMLGAGPIDTDGGWPEPATELVSTKVEAEPTGCLGRLLGRSAGLPPGSGEWARLELNDASEAWLRGGWSPPKVARDDASYRLVIGSEAALLAPRAGDGPARLAIRLWPVQRIGSQQLRVLVNGRPIGVTQLAPSRQTVSMVAPEECWRAGRNLIALQFRHVATPGRGLATPRAAAVDWVELAPLGSDAVSPPPD